MCSPNITYMSPDTRLKLVVIQWLLDNSVLSLPLWIWYVASKTYCISKAQYSFFNRHRCVWYLQHNVLSRGYPYAKYYILKLSSKYRRQNYVYLWIIFWIIDNKRSQIWLSLHTEIYIWSSYHVYLSQNVRALSTSTNLIQERETELFAKSVH